MVRLAYIDALNTLSKGFFTQATSIAIASVVEPGLGIIAISLATLRPLLRVVMRKTRKGRSSSTGYDTGTTGDTNDLSKPPVLAVGSDKSGSQKRGEFAHYGFADDFGKHNDTITETVSGGSRGSCSVQDSGSERKVGEISPPSSCATSSKAHVKPIFSVGFPRLPWHASPSEGVSESSAQTESIPLQLRSAMSEVNIRKSSWSFSFRKGSDMSARQAHKGETWEDLEMARRNWAERARIDQGDAGIQPNLLLPDTDAEEDDVKSGDGIV